MSHAPRWPGWTIPVVLVAVLLGDVVASLAVALIALAFGAEDLTPGLVLLLALVTLAVAVLVLRLVARRAGVALDAPGLGLRRVKLRLGLVVFGFGLLVALAAAGLTSLLGEVDLPHPEELGGESAVIVLDPASAATILARAVLAAIAVEIVLRGYLLPALLPHIGRTGAIVAVGLLSALAVPLDLVPAAAAIGIVLCVMYLESGSILPGIALSGALHGFVLGVRFEWGPWESAGLAAAAGLIALLLVLGPTRSWDPGPRRS